MERLTGKQVQTMMEALHQVYAQPEEQVENLQEEVSDIEEQRLSGTALSSDSEFDVDDGASKAKIKSAFAKSLKSKKMNKKVLGEFIELIA